METRDVACLGCGASSATLLEALPAKHRTALRRLEGDGGLLAAVRARRARFNLLIVVCRSRANGGGTLGFARFTALRFVLELFVVKEKLFTSREEKLRAAINTFQQPVLEFHEKPPFSAAKLHEFTPAWLRGRFDSQIVPNFRFGPHPARGWLTTTFALNLPLLLPREKGPPLGGPLWES